MYSRKNVPIMAIEFLACIQPFAVTSTEEALQSYRPYTGETLPATLDDAVAGTRFSKDRGSAKKRESVHRHHRARLSIVMICDQGETFFI